jgi:hypothetical protein
MSLEFTVITALVVALLTMLASKNLPLIADIVQKVQGSMR